MQIKEKEIEKETFQKEETFQEKEEIRPSKKWKRKENKKYPYRKTRKNV